ncbi:MAG: hypothetical protein HRU20_31610 [Pseudomonadales bacterium]|nr:hypothetical protein [Pseudomonadales bacterium]
MYRHWLSLFLMGSLSACNSGSSSGSNGVTDTTTDTTISIDTKPPVLTEVTTIGTALTSIPEYTFSSDEPGSLAFHGACKSVVSAVTAGNNTLTLNSLEDGFYEDCRLTVTNSSANTSEPLLISAFTVARMAPVSFSAWVGSNDSLVSLPASVDGFEFYRSTESHCDVANYASCDNGQLDILNGEVVTDTAQTLDQEAFYLLKTGSASSYSSKTSILQAADFSPRQLHQCLVFDNKLWLIGGFDVQKTNDVWSSPDGSTWTRMTEAASFSPRSEHRSLVFKDKMWVIAGDDLQKTNDVWSSSDGISWNKETNNDTFTARSSHQVVAFKNKLWVIAGFDGGSYQNDIWSSSDGSSWSQENIIQGFPARSGHQSLVFDNKIWVIGGWDGTKKNDVWSSTDGIEWLQQTANAGFTPRSNHQVVVYNNKMWLLGGWDGAKKNDVWSSSDGITWQEETANAAFPARSKFQTTVFNNRLWLTGGEGVLLNRFKNDVWTSSNGIDWRQVVTGSIRFP